MKQNRVVHNSNYYRMSSKKSIEKGNNSHLNSLEVELQDQRPVLFGGIYFLIAYNFTEYIVVSIDVNQDIEQPDENTDDGISSVDNESLQFYRYT
jgi:hypothetical protein